MKKLYIFDRMQKINAAHSHLHTHFNIVKFNFFIVHYFFDEITAQLCNPGIKTVSISLVFCEQRSHFDCCKWAHAFIYIYYTTTSIVINAVFVVSTVQISRITQHNLCVCVCACIIVSNSKVEFHLDCDTYETLQHSL